MIRSCDTNLLLPAVVSSRPQHRAARESLDALVSQGGFVVCELVLTELYTLLRNPAVVDHPASAPAAAATIQQLRARPDWRVIDYPGGLMPQVWHAAASDGFPFRAIYDARLAVTLRYYGVTEFATRNVKHFESFGFARVWDPLAEQASQPTDR